MSRNQELNNEQRAEAAYRAVMKYQQSDFDVETGIIDLVADLLHLARENGIEPDYIIHMAQMHFDAEIEEEAAA
jgi:Fic family protein